MSEPWWISKRDELLSVATTNLNAFVYDSETIKHSIAKLRSLQSVDRVLYAVKANFNADVLRCIARAGVDFDCVSPGEVARLREAVARIDNRRILFTPNFAPRHEYEWAISEGIQLTLDNLYPLQEWPSVFKGQELLLRVDPGEGQGHHAHVKTAGDNSKFGISARDLEETWELVEKLDIAVTGIHAHIGSGIQDATYWPMIANELLEVAKRFPSASVLDLGGGFAVPSAPDDIPFDVNVLDELLSEFQAQNPNVRIWLEPGRFLVSESGVLLTHVTQLKQKGERRYIGVSTGMNSLIRPALYDAYHEIVNLTRAHEQVKDKVTIVGPICESGDRLGLDREFPATSENDVVLIANAGAYGSVMSSRYNLRDAPREFII